MTTEAPAPPTKAKRRPKSEYDRLREQVAELEGNQCAPKDEDHLLTWAVANILAREVPGFAERDVYDQREIVGQVIEAVMAEHRKG